MLTFGSVFAGVGGFDLGFERASMNCLWQVEIDAKCNAVRRKHWPSAKHHEDVKEVNCGRENLHDMQSKETAGAVLSPEESEKGSASSLQGMLQSSARPKAGLRQSDETEVESSNKIQDDPGAVRSNDGSPVETLCNMQERDGENLHRPLPPDGKCSGPSMSWVQHQAPSGRRSEVQDGSGGILTPVDVICAGFPCQDLSVAGKRAGLSGKRSGLFFEATRVIREMREITDGRSPAFLVLENVPGLLSSNGGRDFAMVLREIAESGAMDIAWSILDAQWFGLAQRRKRVFIVADFRGERAAEILFDSESLSRDSPTRGKAGARVADCLTSGVAASRGVNRPGRRREDDVNLVSLCFNGKNGNRFDGESETFVTFQNTGHGWWNESDVATTIRTPDGGGSVEANVVAHQCHGSSVGPMGTLRSGKGDVSSGVPFTVAFDWQKGNDVENPRPSTMNIHEEKTPTLGSTRTPAMQNHSGVRRLTPRECERLQGFPDDWTRWDADGNEVSDSARYRMLGNAVAVPVSEWIGKRIIEATKNKTRLVTE